MTDPTAPTAEDVIAEALMARDAEDVDWIDRDSAERYAAAVVAAICAMTAEQLADLRPDLTIERYGSPGWQRSRVVGPWREDPS